MNIAAAAKLALRRAPASMRGPIVFTDATSGATSTGEGYATAAQIDGADGFKAGTVVASKARVLTVLPDGLRFPPAAGQTCEWAEVVYTVLAAKPFPEVGEPAVYYVTVSR